MSTEVSEFQEQLQWLRAPIEKINMYLWCWLEAHAQEAAGVGVGERESGAMSGRT